MIDALAVLDCEQIKLRDDVFYLHEVRETNVTYVCRLRQKNKNELEFFVMADNLRRGAAYNAVKIVKNIISKIYKFI